MKETETEQRKEALTFQGIHKGYIEEDIFFKLIPLTDEGREAAKTLWKMRGDDNWVGLKRNVIVDVPEDEENTICQPGRYVCIAMEKCIQPLTDYWKVKSVSYDEILIKLRSILTALEFIHGKSIVHNAITMRKLLLTDGEQLKICPSRKSRKFGPGDDEGLLDMAKLYDLLNYEFTKYIQPPSKETSEKVLFDNLCQHLSSYSATRALYHPFLWSAEKKLLFLKLAGDEFDHRENNEANAKLEAELKRAFTGSWADKMRLSSDEQQKWFTVPDILRDRKDVTDMLYAKSVQPKNPNAGKKRPETEKVKKYDEKSGIELLRFIRNVYSHWEGDISKMERVFQLESQTLFKCEKDVWNFFSWRFPKLLLALYDFILTEDVEDVRKGLVKKGFLPLMVEK